MSLTINDMRIPFFNMTRLMKKYFILFLLFIGLSANAQPFRFIVAADGSGDYTSVQAALNACPDGAQSMIFIKNGTYTEQVSLGSKTVASTKRISLVGESAKGVIITHSQSRASSGSPTFEDICTVKIYATDFYAENITIQNTAGNTGMAEALYTAGDRQTFKNCRILGYQDTYRSKKGTRGYFKNCWIEGAVDFIYAGGVLFFDDCTINCVKGGGYITAPEDAVATIPKTTTVVDKFIRIGFFFRNCNITANIDVPDNSYYLGRPWNINSGTIYLNCKLGKHIRPIGWQTWNGNETSACFAEYNSMNSDGAPIDVSARATWSFQLPKADVDNLLSPENIYARVNSSVVYDPVTLCIPPAAPTNVTVSGNVVSWDPVGNVAGFIVYKNNNFVAAVSGASYTDTATAGGHYSIVSVSTQGVLSARATTPTSAPEIRQSAVKFIVSSTDIRFSQPVAYTLRNLDGKVVSSSDKFVERTKVSHLAKGIYLLQVKDENALEGNFKIKIP